MSRPLPSPAYYTEKEYVQRLDILESSPSQQQKRNNTLKCANIDRKNMYELPKYMTTSHQIANTQHTVPSVYFELEHQMDNTGKQVGGGVGWWGHGSGVQGSNVMQQQIEGTG